MKNYKLEIKWAVIFSVAQIIWFFIEKSFGLHDELISKHATYTNLFSVLVFALFYMALIDKRKNVYGGFMSYKEGFFTGISLSFFITILSPIIILIFNKFISPNFFQNAINYAVESGVQTKEAAESFFNLKSYILYTLAFTPFLGIVTSAIMAIFTQRKQKN